MDYQKVYDAIIFYFAENPVEPGQERDKHHIVPRCMGGSDAPDNIIALPPRYHFVAHLCLAKIYGGKLAHAAYRMSNQGRYGSRKFEWLRRRNMEALKGNKFSLGFRPSAETRAKLSAVRKGKKRPPEAKRGLRPQLKGFKHTEETREKMRRSSRHLKPSSETIEKARLKSLGNTWGKLTKGKKKGPMSEDHKLKIAETMRKTRAEKFWSKDKTKNNT